jgi:hypothetical protein
MAVMGRLGVIVFASVFLVAGCQAPTDAPPGGEDVVEERAPEAPEFIPERIEGGGARENQPHIDYLLQKALADSGSEVEGTAMVDVLVSGGYGLENMELTPDSSLIELPADSTSLAVKFDGECVITQWGTDWYASSVEPTIAGDRCLLGETVSLD